MNNSIEIIANTKYNIVNEIAVTAMLITPNMARICTKENNPTINPIIIDNACNVPVS